MNPEEIVQRYLKKYQITWDHPEHGLVYLTSTVWLAHPELQRAVLTALTSVKGMQDVSVTGPEQLTLRYQSTQLRQVNPLSLLAAERKINRQYRQAGISV